MTDIIKSLRKRTLSFVMALLMIFSSFIIFKMPTSEAAATEVLNQSNWKGWYECFLNDRSTMDALGNLTVPTYTGVTGSYLHQQGFNPLSVSGGKIVSTIKQGNRGWDDFVAVSSDNYTYPAGYSITVDIQTGKDVSGVTVDSIADGSGFGTFSIAIAQQTGLATQPFNNWLWGVSYGLCGTKGYVVTFSAGANSKNYYDYYAIYKTDSSNNITNIHNSSNLNAKQNLTSKIAMANGTSAVTLKLVRTGTDTYNIVLSNTNGLSQTLATGVNIDDHEKLYYGVGAFASGLTAIDNANNKPITSSAFSVNSVSDCAGSYLPANFTGGNHKIVGEEKTNYYLESCSVCGYAYAKKYNITFDANGGTGAPSNTAKAYTCSNNAEAKATYTVSSTKPTRAGYTFTGWKAVTNDSNINGNIYQPGNSIKTGYHLKLVAQWGETTYNLTLDTAGGTMPSGYSTSYTFKHEQKLSDVIGGFPVPTRSGYTFNGWKFTTSGEHWTDGWGTQPYTWGQNVTITAQWIANTYTVSFDKNGDTQITFNGQPITVTFGSTYGTLPSISRVGYTFNGWYTAASGGTRITSSSTVSTASDHTLYAHWTANSYTLTFNLNGGTQASGYNTSYTFKQDQKFVDVIGGYPAPIKRGYLFDGWKNLATGEHWKGGWGTQPYTYGANVTLTAQWVEDPDFKPYYLIFDVNGGNITSNHSTVYGIATGDKYADIIGTIPTAERTGYTFGGWYSSKYNYTLEINGTFTAAEDVTLVAQWIPIQSVVTLNLNDTTGTKATCSVSSITVSYGGTYSALPTPTRTGYTFNGWYTAASGGTKITTSTTVSITSAQTLYAHWTANSYTMTLVLQGGTMPGGYKESYTFLADQSFNDVIGGYPVPTREGYNFLGWQWTNHTDHYWKNGWGTQIYYFGQNITVYARWQAKTFTVTFNKNASDATLNTTSKTVTYGEQYGTLPEPSRGDEYIFDGWYTSAEGGTKVTASTTVTATANHTLYAHWLDAATYTVTFNSNGYINVQKYGVAQQVKVTDTSLPGGGTTSSFSISNDQTFASAVGNDAYFPTHNLWTFVGWLATYNDANGNPKFVILSGDNWTTAVFDGTSDVTCTAYYQCLHSRFSNAISVWEENASTGNRVIGKCRVCGFDGAYGYRVNFLARYNNAGDILLSYGVPQNELFTYENCIYDSTNGIIIDFLDIKTSHPTITIQFNPILLAARDPDAGWLGWSVEGTSLTPQKHMQIIFNQDDDNWNHHLRLRSQYESGYNEIVFNAASGLKGEHVDNGVLVDTNRRYGVLAIRNAENYHDILDYIPQAKHIAVYHYPNPAESSYFNPIQFSNGNFHSYSNSANTLYCSIGWTDSNHFAGVTDPLRTQSMMNAWHGNKVLNSLTCHNACSLTKDVQMSPWYFSTPKYNDSGDSINDDGVSQGYMATFYANNKGSSEDYNNAYFDLDEKSGGTMYYMYAKTGSSYTCVPVFGFHRSDYEGNPKVFIFEPGSPAECMADFNITVYDSAGYFNTYDFIIAKEPKRYTYYMGEGDHYVFPSVVADPDGNSYTYIPYEHGDSTNVDPGFDLVTDNNGNEYYNSLPNNRFKLSRNSDGAPVANIYTLYATWGNTGFGDPLPLGYPGISYYMNGKNALYTPVFPHGNKQTYFVTGNDYQDYGYLYGAGIPLTYPDGNAYISMYPKLSAQGLPMQAAYYMQWDFELTFNANYPEGQQHDNVVGYPTSLPGNRTANIDDNGNHYVYGFFNAFESMQGLNNKMFTCADYVIDGWQLYNQAGQPIIYDHDYDNSTPGEYLIIDTSENVPSWPKDLSQIEAMKYYNDYTVSIYDAYIYAREPGCEFRAIWKRIYNYTLIEDEADKGAANFAKVKYKDRFNDNVEVYLTETTTLKVCPETKITVSEISASSGYSYEYLTLNNQKYPTVPGRIVTNKNSYNFTILGDTTMTAQFVSNSSTAKLLIDRNNWLLSKWANRLYSSEKSLRDGSNSFYAAGLSPSYALYKNGTSTYTVTVSGSTFADVNKSYTENYDEVITLMTDAKKGSSRFVGWKVNDSFVSYDPIFDYRVTGTVTVTAVYSGTATQTVSISSISNNDDSREGFAATHSAPEGYKLIEAGFLVSTTNHSFTIEDVGECMTSSNYEKIVSANQSANGTFKLLVAKGTHYVAAYAYYYDKSGKIVSCISSTIQQ